MGLQTGTPLGTITAMEELYIELAPYLYFQDYDDGHYAHNPDGDGFYWGLSGTVANPAYQAGCYQDVQLREDLTLSEVRCDAIGDKAATQRRNFIDLTFTLTSLFPLSVLTHMIHGGDVTTNAGSDEKMGIGSRDNNQFWRVYLPVVYDEDTGDYLAITGHRCQFISALELDMSGDERWSMALAIRMFADEDVPAAQKFATIIRADPSAL